jgi:2-hydroxy-3-keto-5-methylthiopentenyl-1-phosphate phosphatase
MHQEENRKTSPVLAICYDFDKTLSPENMQTGYLRSIGYEDTDKFWKTSNDMAERNEMDQNLSYMYLMAQKSRGKYIFTKAMLRDFGSKVELYPGVDTWFDRINEYGAGQGVEVEHYIISSGLKEMIEGTPIADKFTKIYASTYYYDDAGVAVWPAQVVNYTDKTQFLFRIEKGVTDINDQRVNSYFEPEELRIPFRNIVYIGDSDTDIPCMKLVNVNGGHSIGVYDSVTKDKSKVFRMLEENRIKYFEPADYSEGSPLETLMKSIIDRTRANEILEHIYYSCRSEEAAGTAGQKDEDRRKAMLIDNLEESGSFRYTHRVIAELSTVKSWTEQEETNLLQIALENNQVSAILTDPDVKEFFLPLCRGQNEYAVKVLEKINGRKR